MTNLVAVKKFFRVKGNEYVTKEVKNDVVLGLLYDSEYFYYGEEGGYCTYHEYPVEEVFFHNGSIECSNFTGCSSCMDNSCKVFQG